VAVQRSEREVAVEISDVCMKVPSISIELGHNLMSSGGVSGVER
jgi:hypothetical protein